MKYLETFEVIFLLFTTCDSKSYRDHSLIHATPYNAPILEFFKNLDRFYNVTFWRRPSLVNKSIEFSISRINFAELTRDTRDMNIDFFTVIRDLQTVFDNQTVKSYVRRKMASFDWRDYYGVDDIYNWLKDISEAHPEEVHLQTIGKTIENRNILAVTVTLKGSKDRSKIVIEGGCHGREWISPAFVTYLINTIINAKNSQNKELEKIAYLYEWIFVPVLNPDGYAYSQTTDRLWRKNHRGGYGVDVNRNFGILFGKFGSSTTDKKDEEYCGESAFSERESTALASFAKDNIRNMEYYLAFHSYGQLIIIPYGFSLDHMDNYEEVKLRAKKAAAWSSKKYGISYSVGTAFDTVGYVASGLSTDWIKKSMNVRFVATFELPDQGQHGFALPPSRIMSTCEATLDMLLAFLSPQAENKTKLRENLPKSGVTQGNRRYGVTLFCYVLLFSLYGIIHLYLFLY